MREWHSYLLLIICIFINACKAEENRHYKRIDKEPNVLNASLYDESLMPPCTTEISVHYEDDACFTEKDADSHDGVKIIYNRFIDNLKTIESDRKVMYQKAVCTLGILQSCELREIVQALKADIRTNDLQYYISGEALEFGKLDDKEKEIFPEKYNPENFEDFKDVLMKSILYLNDQKNK